MSGILAYINMRDYQSKFYAASNEIIDAVIQGMDIQKGDRILAICGSGDIPLACLGKSPEKVVAVDRSIWQLRHTAIRAELLQRGFLYLLNNYTASKQNADF